MRRGVTAATIMAMLLIPGTALAAQNSGCPSASAGWELKTVQASASAFFPHLIPGQFATVEAFAAAYAAEFDGNGDGLICQRLKWGFDLNPNSHWWRVGFDVGLGEPVHLLLPRDNNANAQ
jgi:hypothetical protein